jgi:hypothetical protein
MEARAAPTPVSPKYGEFNLSGTVPCSRAEVFFHLLYAEGTHGARTGGFNAQLGYIDFVLYGPITDDANGFIEEGETKASGGAGRALTTLEVEGKTKYEGFEATACLKAEFRLFKFSLYQKFPAEEDRDNFVARVRELGVSGRPLETLCSIFSIRRVR